MSIEASKKNDQKTTLNNAENYSVYNYFRKHPSAFIATVSGVIAVVTFVIKSLDYYSVIQHLRYWGFTTNQIDYQPSSESLPFLVAFVIVCANTVIQSIALSSFQSYYLRIRNPKIYKVEAKNQERYLKRKAREFKKGERKKPKTEDLIELKDEINSCLIRSKSILHKLFLYRLRMLAVLFIQLSAPALFLTVSYFFLIHFYASDAATATTQSFIYSLGLSLFGIVISYMFSKVIEWHAFGKKLKKARKSEEDFLLFKKQIIEETDKNPSLFTQKTIKEKIKTVMADSRIENIITVFIICILLFIMVFIMKNNQSIQNRRDFWVINDNNQDYVLIYQNENIYYFDEAELNEDELKVYTSQHLIIKADHISLKKVHFENIERIENEN